MSGCWLDAITPKSLNNCKKLKKLMTLWHFFYIINSCKKIFWESISHPREKINLAVYYRKKVVAVIVKELYNLTEILLFTLRRLRAKIVFFIECSIPSQEINRVFSISRCYILIWANIAIPSRKYSIKEPAKSRNSAYVSRKK